VGLPYPNPVIINDSVSIDVQATGKTTIEMDVFTVAFRKVAWNTQYVSNTTTMTWNLRDHWNKPVADGLYYLRVKVMSGRTTVTKVLKVLILR
jgi:hypothetical protein